VLLVLVLLAGVPRVMCILEAKYWTFIAGIVLGLFWLVRAIRLAKPRSWWARCHYGKVKLARAVECGGS